MQNGDAMIQQSPIVSPKKGGAQLLSNSLYISLICTNLADCAARVS